MDPWTVRRPQWLIVTPNIPRPDHSGGDRRLTEILVALSTDCDLYLVITGGQQDDDGPYEQLLTDSGIKFVGSGTRAALRALIWHGFDAVFFEFYISASRLLPIVRRMQPHALVIVDSVDLHYLREQEAARLGLLRAEVAVKTEIEEIDIYRKADVVVAVSTPEAALLRERGLTDLEIIPIIVRLSIRNDFEREPQLLFVGGFSHLPNRLAVEWFRQDVWPLIRSRMSNASWVIAGSKAPPEIKAFDGIDGVTVLGYVPSTSPLIDRAQISIAPLTYGAGMKVKVCEALAGGLPLVTTKWGAQGLEDGRESAFLVADSPQEFADAVVRLLVDVDERARLSHAGQLFAMKSCSIESAAPVISKLVQRSRARQTTPFPKRIFSMTQVLAAHGLSRFRATPRS